MYVRFSNVSAGLSLVLKCWVKLGTATNFCLTFMDGPSGLWNSLPGQCFTSLSTTEWREVSLAVTFTSYQMRLYIGAHSQTGQTPQSAGSVFVYGWKFVQVGSTTTTLETNLVIDGSMRCTSEIDTGTLACVGITNSGGYTGGTGSFTSVYASDGLSVGTTAVASNGIYAGLGGLATTGPVVAASGSFNSLYVGPSAITGPTLTMGSGSFTTGLNMLGPLTGSNLNGNNYTIDAAGNASFDGNLTVFGNYGAYARMALSTTSYGPGTPILVWGAAYPVSSGAFTHTSSTANVVITQAGYYMMYVNLCQTQASIGQYSVYLQTSTNSGTTWTTVATGQSDVISTVLAYNLSVTELVGAGSGSWWRVSALIPNVGGVYVHWDAASVSTWIIHRVG